jgi:transketolase
MLEKTMTRLAPLHSGPAGEVATRDAYGQALLELGRERPELVVLDADLSGSTKTKAFSQAFPERFFNMGVAEANMMGTAAGLAAMGRTVFASSFAMFAAGKAWEQVRQTICVPKLTVNICATHAGLTVGEDGKSHQMLEDVALMRVLPNMTVIVPADGVEAAAAVRAAADHDGPCYVRLSRAKTPLVFHETDYHFEIGRGAVLREGRDLAIVANGVVLAPALAAAEELALEGIEARVIGMACVKPIDEELLVEAALECGALLSAEEHQVQGGLGSAVAEVLCRRAPVPMEYAGVQGTFGESGTAEELLVKYGLDGPSIAKRARTLLARKRGASTGA